MILKSPFRGVNIIIIFFLNFGISYLSYFTPDLWLPENESKGVVNLQKQKSDNVSNSIDRIHIRYTSNAENIS